MQRQRLNWPSLLRRPHSAGMLRSQPGSSTTLANLPSPTSTLDTAPSRRPFPATPVASPITRHDYLHAMQAESERAGTTLTANRRCSSPKVTAQGQPARGRSLCPLLLPSVEQGTRTPATDNIGGRGSRPAPLAVGPVTVATAGRRERACARLRADWHRRARPCLASNALVRSSRSSFGPAGGERSCPGLQLYDYRGRGAPSHRLGRIHLYVRSCFATGTERERSDWRT